MLYSPYNFEYFIALCSLHYASHIPEARLRVIWHIEALLRFQPGTFVCNI